MLAAQGYNGILHFNYVIFYGDRAHTVPCRWDVWTLQEEIIIIAIKTALWQFSKKSYCVLVHGPRLKSKKLTKCDSRKLKFHTKPHNNHDTWRSNSTAYNTCLFRHLYLYKYRYMYCANMLACEGAPRGEKVVWHPVWLLWGFVWNFNFRLSHFVNFLLFRRGPWTRTQ